MKVIYTIVIAIIVLFIITFSLQNSSMVPLKYYDLFDTTLPAYMLMFVAFLAGVIFTGLLGFAERLNLTRTIRELNKVVRDLRRELRSNDNTIGEEKRTANNTIEK